MMWMDVDDEARPRPKPIPKKKDCGEQVEPPKKLKKIDFFLFLYLYFFCEVDFFPHVFRSYLSLMHLFVYL